MQLLPWACSRRPPQQWPWEQGCILCNDIKSMSTFCKPPPVKNSLSMHTLVEDAIRKVCMFINNMWKERLKFGPYCFNSPSQDGVEVALHIKWFRQGFIHSARCSHSFSLLTLVSTLWISKENRFVYNLPYKTWYQIIEAQSVSISR